MVKQYNIVPLNGFLYVVDESQSVNKGWRYWVSGEDGKGRVHQNL